MKFSIDNVTFVLVGNNHNPSIISEYFLVKTGIIKSPEQIERSALIVTPAVSQYVIKGKADIQITPTKLSVSAATDDYSYLFDIVNKYCRNLPYIKTTAFGINLAFNIEDYDGQALLNSAQKLPKGASINQINCVEVVDKIASMHVSMLGTNIGGFMVTFNHHHEYPEMSLEQLLGDFDMNKLFELYLHKSAVFINNTFI